MVPFHRVPRHAADQRERQGRSPPDRRRNRKRPMSAPRPAPTHAARTRRGGRNQRASWTLIRNAVTGTLSSGAARCSGPSGGIDSSVTAACACRGVGTKRVLGALMPGTRFLTDSQRLGRLVADHFGIETVVEISAPRSTPPAAPRAATASSAWRCVLRAGLEMQDRARRYRCRLRRFLSGRIARRRTDPPPHVGRGLSRRHRGREHEAAHAQAARILPRRPPGYAVAGTPNRSNTIRASS